MTNQTIQKTTDAVNKNKNPKLGMFYLIIFLLMLSSHIFYSGYHFVILLITLFLALLIWGIRKGALKKHGNLLKMFIFSSVCVGLVASFPGIVKVDQDVFSFRSGWYHYKGFISDFLTLMFGIVILSSPLVNTSPLLSFFQKIKNGNLIPKSPYLKLIIQLMIISSVCLLATRMDILAYLVYPCTITGMCRLAYDENVTAAALMLVLSVSVFFTAFYGAYKKTIPTFGLNLIVGIMSTFILNPRFSAVNVMIVIPCFCLWFITRFIAPLITKIGPNIITKPLSINRMFYLSVSLPFILIWMIGRSINPIISFMIILFIMCFYAFLFKRFKWCSLIIMIVIALYIGTTEKIQEEVHTPYASEWCDMLL